MIGSLGKSFVYALVRSSAGVVAVAAAPVIIRTVRKAIRQRRQVCTGWHKARIRIARWMVRKGQGVGCDAEDKLYEPRP